ncbi:MAG TPA: hypothetical protein VNP98_17150 [Chthoniobacterales bacterium]|nr:hypothetical protein [Chthoniobacterales bacterium]
MQAALRAIESALNVYGDQAHKHELSWREARQTAAEWLAANGYQKKREVKGLVIDLQPFGGSLEATGRFRQMALQAASRLLKSRGADSVLLPD